jgi:hypothetical protein
VILYGRESRQILGARCPHSVRKSSHAAKATVFSLFGIGTSLAYLSLGQEPARRRRKEPE